MADETVTEPVNTAAPEEQATTPAGGQAARCRPGRRHRRLFRG